MDKAIRLGWGSIKRVLVVRFPAGYDVLESLRQVVEEQDIRAGAILTGLASLRRLRIRDVKNLPEGFPEVRPDQQINEIEGPLEVINFAGLIMVHEGKILIHPHVTAADSCGKVYGGHLLEGTIVFSTCEMLIGQFEGLTMETSWCDLSGSLYLFPATQTWSGGAAVRHE